MGLRLENEILHGKKLAAKGAEDVWNWSGPVGQARANRRAEYFVQTAHITSSDRGLEIGCGTGLFTRKVQEATRADITATDLSEDLLEEARAKFPAGNFVVADAMHLEFPDNSFDVVYGSSILHHLEMHKALDEIFRVMKPKGRMVFAEPNMLNPQILIQKNIPFIKAWLGDSPDETAIVRWKFETMMKFSGFREIRIFPYDFLHPITPKALIGVVHSVGAFIEKIPLLKEIAGSVIIYGEK